MNRFFICIVCVFILLGCSSSSRTGKLSSHKRHTFKNHTPKRKLTIRRKESFKLVDLFVSEQKQNEIKCPSKKKEKRKERGRLTKIEGDLETDIGGDKVRLLRRSESINFDIIHVEEKQLDIPAFKQFKNNMTDFTANGEEEFKKIIDQIREYLGTNTDGNGVTLFIHGHASQIPTSFDPSKPNNNINPDGSSIKGETSIENNVKLAHARAQELANKITLVFRNINILTPDLENITLGRTAWTAKTQKALDKAYLKGDTIAIKKVYEPFQADQYVTVESNEIFIKTVQPEAIRMYTVSFLPRAIFSGENGDVMVKSSAVVSAETYRKLGGDRTFSSIELRKEFLKEIGLELMKTMIYDEVRWFLVADKKEVLALQIQNDYNKLYALYELGMVHRKDYEVLEQIITDKYLKDKKYNYIMKDNAGF